MTFTNGPTRCKLSASNKFQRQKFSNELWQKHKVTARGNAPRDNAVLELELLQKKLCECVKHTE